jgi:subtilisin family serine protease
MLLSLSLSFSLSFFASPALSASDEITAIVAQFVPGEVQFSEETYPASAPLDRVTFRTPQVRLALSQSGVFALTLVCPGWRHLQAPQYDINGEEIPVEQMVDFADVYKLEWTGPVPPLLIRANLTRLPQVVYVELMSPMELDTDPPNDEYYPLQWGLHNTGQDYPPPNVECVPDVDINAPEAWEYQDTCTVKVGILDTGIDGDHEDLQGAVDPNLHFGPDNGQTEIPCDWPHGSAVAGIVGAVGANGLGIAGAASPKGGRFLVSMRAAPDGECRSVTPLLVSDAVAWATTTAFPQIPIVNSSFSGSYQGLLNLGCYPTLRNAFRNGYLKGLFLTASAGNEVSSPHPQYPAAFPDYTTAVAAVRCDGSHSPDYNLGVWIDVAAPGGAYGGGRDSLAHIVTPWGTQPDHSGYWGIEGRPYFGGTSAAAPYASGVAALLLSKRPDVKVTNDDLDGILKATARDLGDPGPDPYFGHGLIRADSALHLIESPHVILKNKTTPVRITYVGTITDDFMNIPCVSTDMEVEEQLEAAVYEMVGYAPFAQPALAVWTRGRPTIGWHDFRQPWARDLPIPIDGLAYGNWAEVVPETVTAEGCSLRAYTYRFYRAGSPVGWFPVDGGTGLPACSSVREMFLAYGYVTAGDDLKTRADGEAGVSGGPNPSDLPYSISWTLLGLEQTEAAIYDVTGRRVKAVFSGPAGPGDLRLTWDGRDAGGRIVPAGVFFLRVRAGASCQTVKIVR